jgi:hypothetical protein
VHALIANGCTENGTHMVTRGAVRNEALYRQGYDHSAWGDILPRRITPSDIDVVFDNLERARVLFCEFTRNECWADKPFGQRTLYMQLLRTNNYQNACVLCHHCVDGRDIDSLTDVQSFHVMRCNNGEIEYMEVIDGCLWGEFVKAFYGLENTWGQWWN